MKRLSHITSIVLASLLLASPSFAAQGETVEFDSLGFGLMVASYLVLWVLIAGFVGALIRRQKRVAKQIDALKSSLDDQAASVFK